MKAYLRWVGLASKVLLSHYRRHIGQGLFLFLGLVLGVALWSSVTLINQHAQASYQDADQLLGTQAKYLIRANEGGVPASLLNSLSTQGFNGLYPVIEGQVTSESGRRIALLATDLERLSGASFAPLPLYTLLPRQLAEQLNVRQRQVIALENGRFLPPAVLTDAQQVITHIRYAMPLLERNDYDYIGVPALANERIGALQSLLPASTQLVRNQQALDLQELTDSLHIQLAALGWLAFVVGLFIVFNAVRFSLHSRRQSMQTLRELGLPASALGCAIIVEALIWSLLGTVFGGGAGFILANTLLPSVAASLQSLFGAVVSPSVSLSVAHWLQAAVMTLLGVTLAIAGPLWFSARFTSRPRLALNKWLLSIALALLISSTWLASSAQSVAAGFVLLTVTLFGWALLLPVGLHAIAKWVHKRLPARFWLARWAVSDAFAQLPHLRIAMMAVLLALVANIGVSLLVGSFRVALSDWLTVRLSAQVYVQPEVDIKQIRQAPEVKAAHTRLATNERWGSRPAEIYGVDPQAPDMQALPLQSGQLTWQGSPQPVLVNEQAHHLEGAQLGDIIRLPNSDLPLQITGFFHDYGNPYYAFYLPKSVVAEHWPQANPQGHALWIETTDIAALMRQYGIGSDQWIDQSELLSIALAIFDRTFAITGALNTLTFAVAGIALLAALITVHQQRQAQYLQWRSLGVSVREWAVIVMSPILLMVLTTFALSIPIGIWLSALLVNDINVIAFGWSMPLVVHWQPFAWLLAFTLAMYVLSSGIAAWRVGRDLA